MAAKPSLLQVVQRIVVLMLENRSFDHTLGWETQQPFWGVLPGTVATNIIDMFTPEMLPVLSAVAAKRDKRPRAK
jgi:phospholipase C